MGCRKSPRAFKWCYEMSSYWGKINEPTKEEVERCYKDRNRISHCKHQPWMLGSI